MNQMDNGGSKFLQELSYRHADRCQPAPASIDQDCWGRRYPKIQILMIEDLLNGRIIDYPRYGVGTFKKARPITKAHGTVQGDWFGSPNETTV